ncbi:MAG: hypothetical protein OXU23_06305 [Candidatus Poribacteria bacterium]|nr:hypothetical protein [Candidatus Poribacteria bacterium]
MNTTELTNELVSLMGLRPGELPSVEINKKSAPRRLIGQLVRQNYIPSYSDAPDALKWLVEGEGDCQPDPSIHIIDLLGVYQSRNNKVILYDLLIQLCALKLGVDYAGLQRIVLLHELSHAVTHRGLDSDDRIWECFDIADKESKEYFAQIYTYKFLQDTEQSCLTIMNKLSEIQPRTYQTYQESIDTDVNIINKDLWEARRVVPTGFELYPESLKESWEIHFDNLQRYRSPKLVKYVLGLNTRQQYETISEGTQFSITANKIRIKSYDYSPSSSEFSVESTLQVYCLILNHLDEIKEKSTNNETQKPLFYVVLGNGKYYLNLADPFAHDLWNKIVPIISNDYPALGRVLEAYKFS